MRCAFHPEAEAEFVKAVEYDEEREAGLGYDFTVEVYSTIERILAHPKAWASHSGRNQKIVGQKVSIRSPLRRRG